MRQLKSVKNPKSNREFKRHKRVRRVEPIQPIHVPKGFWANNKDKLTLWLCSLVIPAIGVAAGFHGVLLVVCVVLWVMLFFYPVKLYREHKILMALGADEQDELIAEQQFKALEDKRNGR